VMEALLMMLLEWYLEVQKRKVDLEVF